MKRIAQVLKWPTTGGACLLCRSGAIKDAAHFVQTCPVLAGHRSRFFSTLEDRLSQAGSPGAFILAKGRAGGFTQLSLLLGSRIVFPACPLNVDVVVYSHQCAKALCILNKTSNNYLSVIWRHRTAIIGELKIIGNNICRKPPDIITSTSLLSRPFVQHVSNRVLHTWKLWLPHVHTSGKKSAKYARNRSKKGRWGFYRVWQGRRTGVFYRWSHCKASICGHPDPGFRGFDSIAAAQAHIPT